jgi:HlyD family secretion protein
MVVDSDARLRGKSASGVRMKAGDRARSPKVLAAAPAGVERRSGGFYLCAWYKALSLIKSSLGRSMTQTKIVRWVMRSAVVAAVALAVGYGSSYYFGGAASDLPEYETILVTKGELAQVVTASGQLNPVVRVDVGSQISGNIQKLLVDYNSPVTKGQIIAQLDPATYEAALIQTEGYLATARAAQSLALLSTARAKALHLGQLAPEAEYERVQAELQQADAAVKINEGIVKKAQVDLARCTIYAPIDGVVISRNVNVGQTVAASLSAPTLFVIANDLSKMQIEANVAEADIGVVELGQDVDFTVDAFPGQIFHGKVSQVRNAPKIEQNVVTYETIIDVTNAKRKLKPGMTANVSIVVARREDALKIPNAALRFRPPAPEAKKASLLGGGDSSSKSKKKSSGSKKEKHKAEKTVYILGSNGTNSLQRVPQPVQIKPGITDNSFTEVLDGLKEGDQLIVGATTTQASLGPVSSLFGGARKKH